VNLDVLADGEAVARSAADIIASKARDSIAARGRFLLAVSGGHTPGRMLQLLAECEVPWPHVSIFQVDERVAPRGDKNRNLTQLSENLLTRVPLPPDQLYAMPVERDDLSAAADCYAAALAKAAAGPIVFDLIHLGLGADGHTASLTPGDPVLAIADRDVAVTNPYNGLRRMTLTFPAINRARNILWVVVGADKHGALARLRKGDQSIPAGRIQAASATILADVAAASSNSDLLIS
jgi:6-phosphogluconolactonase